MNQTTAKCGLLAVLNHELRISWRQLAKYSAVIFGVIAAIVIFIVYSNRDYYYGPGYAPYYFSGHDRSWDVELAVFGIALFLCSCISASLIMSNFITKPQRINSLMLPAPQLSKFIARWVIFVPLIFVVFLVSCELVDLLRYVIFSIKYPFSNDIRPLSSHIFNPDDEYRNLVAVISFVIASAILQSFFVLGSTLWPKAAAVKTILALQAYSIVISIASSIAYNIFIDPEYSYGWEWVEVIHISDWQATGIFAAIGLVVCLINYTIAYFRYKEIEIIQRW